MEATLETKQAYALALLDKDDTYQAALVVTGGDISKALIMSRELAEDPEVQALKFQAQEADDAYGIPSKHDVVREVWARAQKCAVAEDAFKGFKLVADLMGYIEKKDTTINNNTLVDNRKVMVVTDHGSDNQWETKLLAQQAALTNDCSSGPDAPA